MKKVCKPETRLHDAHISLTKACTFVLESIEDSLFIQALDLIALSLHRNHWQTAKTMMIKFELDFDERLLKYAPPGWPHEYQKQVYCFV